MRISFCCCSQRIFPVDIRICFRSCLFLCVGMGGHIKGIPVSPGFHDFWWEVHRHCSPIYNIYIYFCLFSWFSHISLVFRSYITVFVGINVFGFLLLLSVLDFSNHLEVLIYNNHYIWEDFLLLFCYLFYLYQSLPSFFLGFYYYEC